MNKIIIGSTAIKYHFSDFNRIPKDIDYAVVSKNNFKSTKEVEYLENPILFKYSTSEYLEPNYLYTLKISHIFWDINWDKHMWDINFLKEKGCKIDINLFWELYNYWNNYHGKNRRSNYNMSAQEFFDNAVTYPIEHDELHKLIQDPPSFKKILKDNSEVDVDLEKWNKLSHEEKCAITREELYVMAIERTGNRDYRHSYSWMIKKFILNHCPVEGSIWIIENYKELCRPLVNYKQLLKEKLKYAD